MTSASFASLAHSERHSETQNRAEAEHSVRRAGPFPSHTVFKGKLLAQRDLVPGQACGETGAEGCAGSLRNQTPHLPENHLSPQRACPCRANSPRTHHGAVPPGNIGGFLVPGRRCRGHVHLIINSPAVNDRKEANQSTDLRRFYPECPDPSFKNYHRTDWLGRGRNIQSHRTLSSKRTLLHKLVLNWGHSAQQGTSARVWSHF